MTTLFISKYPPVFWSPLTCLCVCVLSKHSFPPLWTICSWPCTHRATQCRAEWFFTHSSLDGKWLGRLLLWKPGPGVCAALIDLMLMTWGWLQALKECVTMMNGVQCGGVCAERAPVLTCEMGPMTHHGCLYMFAAFVYLNREQMYLGWRWWSVNFNCTNRLIWMIAFIACVILHECTYIHLIFYSELDGESKGRLWPQETKAWRWTSKWTNGVGWGQRQKEKAPGYFG